MRVDDVAGEPARARLGRGSGARDKLAGLPLPERAKLVALLDRAFALDEAMLLQARRAAGQGS
jgi:hypothetical protein